MRFVKEHEPQEYTADERDHTARGDCPSRARPTYPGAMPYLCSLDEGHSGPHRAGIGPTAYIASWGEVAR